MFFSSFSFVFLKNFCHVFAEVLDIIKKSVTTDWPFYIFYESLPAYSPSYRSLWHTVITCNEKTACYFVVHILLTVHNQILIFMRTLPLITWQFSFLKSLWWEIILFWKHRQIISTGCPFIFILGDWFLGYQLGKSFVLIVVNFFKGLYLFCEEWPLFTLTMLTVPW